MAWSDLLKIRTWSLNGAKTENVTDAVKSMTWSGSYRDCARQLSFDVRSDALAELGSLARLYHGTDKLFSGTIFERSRDSKEDVLSCVAYDKGIFLKRNSVQLAVRSQTPEAVTRRLCGEYGITAGDLAATGVPLSRNFIGSSIYQVIQTLYTLASDATGEKYQIRFQGDTLNVQIKSRAAATLRLIPGNNLISCNAKDSVSNMVNSVGVYDDSQNLTTIYNSPENTAALYGLMRSAIRAGACDDPEKTAKALLEDNGVKTTITAECIGNVRLITGNTVALHEPVTGTDGLFWILSDSHTCPNGIYRTKVTLDFKNLMDKQDAGSVPKE